MSVSAGTRLGHYEILTPLGKGGMGEAYLAQDTRLRRKVALKLLADVAGNPDQGAKEFGGGLDQIDSIDAQSRSAWIKLPRHWRGCRRKSKLSK